MKNAIHETDVLDLLAATLAHEVKNPLSMMRANIEYMALCDSEGTNSKFYDALKRQLDKADHMVNHAVTVLRDTHKKEPVRLCQILKEVSEDFVDGLGGRLTIALNLDDGGYCVLGSPPLLEMMFSNILKNALDAGATQVNASLKPVEGCAALRLRFADNGDGLPAGTEKALNSGEVCSTRALGNGLGVDFCRSLVSKMGGGYSIANSEGIGNGCVVEIVLPALAV